MTELENYGSKAVTTRNFRNQNSENREKWLNRMQLAMKEAYVYLCIVQSEMEQLDPKVNLKDWNAVMNQLESEIPEILNSKDILPYLNIGRGIMKLRMVKTSELAWEKYDEFIRSTKNTIYKIENFISNQY